MKVILTAADLLPLVRELLAKRYPEFDKARIEFIMKRKAWFSSEAEVTVECELTMSTGTAR